MARPRRARDDDPAPHVVVGRRAVEEALAAQRPLLAVHLDARARHAGLAEALTRRGVPVHAADAHRLDELAGGLVHQGVVALAPAPPTVPLERLVGADLVVVLDGVTDPRNVGAIARTAEAAGAAGLVLRGRRAAGVTPAAERAAAGALSWLPVAVVTNVVRALGQLAEGGAWSVGLDGEATTTLWGSHLLDGPVVVVIGAEGQGLSRLVRERVDERVRIPMSGHVASLNAGAAAAVALFEVARRRAGQPADGAQPTGGKAAVPSDVRAPGTPRKA